MTDRTVYILGRILGRMTIELKVDGSVALLNAFKNPWAEISLLHIGYFRKGIYTKELADYMSAMVQQIEISEDITSDIYPAQQNALTIGFETGKHFNIADEMAVRHITQQQLADKLGVNRMTVNRWVNESIPEERQTEVELAIYSISGIIGNGYSYNEKEKTQ